MASGTTKDELIPPGADGTSATSGSGVQATTNLGTTTGAGAPTKGLVASPQVGDYITDSNGTQWVYQTNGQWTEAAGSTDYAGNVAASSGTQAPYSISEITSEQVYLGTGSLPGWLQLSNNPADGNGVASVGDIMNEVQKMSESSQSDLIQLQNELWNAGYYQDAESGGAQQTRPNFGTYDPQTEQALYLALSQSANALSASNYSGSGAVSAGVPSFGALVEKGFGGTAAELTGTPSPTVSGGGVSDITLTNPLTIANGITQTWQSLGLGTPSPEIIKTITAQIQGQQESQGQTQAAAQNTAAQSEFQGNVTAANQEYDVQHDPNISATVKTLGNVPAGANYSNSAQFAVGLLTYMQLPVTQSNVTAITAWAQREGGNWNNTAAFNPLNSTQTATGSQTMSGGSSAGVQAYTSWAQGIVATADTLLQGDYTNIIAALKTGNAEPTFASGGLGDELTTWSGKGYTAIDPSLANTQTVLAAIQASQTQAAQASTATQASQTQAAQASTPATGPKGGPVDWYSSGTITNGANVQPAPAQAARTEVPPQVSASSTGVNSETIPAAPNSYTPTVVDTTTNAPSSSDYAYAAETGPQRGNYLAYQFLQNFNSLANFISGHGVSGASS